LVLPSFHPMASGSAFSSADPLISLIGSSSIEYDGASHLEHRERHAP
jgi:hypothetical protein